jgi:hypothetical protein
MQTNTNNVNKTSALLQTTGGKRTKILPVLIRYCDLHLSYKPGILVYPLPAPLYPNLEWKFKKKNVAISFLLQCKLTMFSIVKYSWLIFFSNIICFEDTKGVIKIQLKG